MDAQLIAKLAEESALSTQPQNAAEKFFDALGLMRGTWTPLGRLAVGFGVGAAAMWALRPSFAFDEEGRPLDSSEAMAPWWTVPVALGAYSAVFV